MSLLTPGAWIEGVSEALATLARNPLRASLAGLAMAVAVATTAVVQTGLDGLAQSARQASERAFGSDAFVVAKVAGANLSRRALAEKPERNPTSRGATSDFSTRSPAISSSTPRRRSGRPTSARAAARSRTHP
jgi:hypothetical protein